MPIAAIAAESASARLYWDSGINSLRSGIWFWIFIVSDNQLL